MNAYDGLAERFRRRALLGEAAAMLHWDRATVMPPGGAAAREEQLAALARLRQALLADTVVEEQLAAAERAADDDPWRRRNLALMRRAWKAANAVPPDLQESLIRAGLRCEMAWRAARPANDFAALRPHLETVVDLVRQVGAARASAFECSTYDALLDQYEPGLRAGWVDEIFADLADFLPPFVEAVLARQDRDGPPAMPAGPFPIERQRALCEKLMARLGFDFDHGRLDVSLHPFTGGVADDIRITTRFEEDDFTHALMATLHETGHALYEAGLPSAWRRQPVGASGGMALHESQSLLIEMQVCRGGDFLAFLAPELVGAFGADPAFAADNLRRIYTRVERGLIRVDADEVTYPLHVILRYRLERALIAGELAVADLPGAWNEGMAELIGVTPPDDRLGVMQDIHWMDGNFGYFPTYTLGALAAAQLFRAAAGADSSIEAAIGAGDFRPLLAWLRANVHEKGSLVDTRDLIAEVTGAPLGTADFKAHLHARYLR